MGNFDNFEASDSGMSYPVAFTCAVCETDFAENAEVITLTKMLEIATEHSKVCDQTRYYMEWLYPDNVWKRNETAYNSRILKGQEDFYKKYHPNFIYRIVKAEQ
jgi:hypothetical protein